jgi:hypothetical protein
VKGQNQKEIENNRLIESVNKVTDLLRETAHMRDQMDRYMRDNQNNQSEIFNVTNPLS